MYVIKVVKLLMFINIHTNLYLCLATLFMIESFDERPTLLCAVDRFTISHVIIENFYFILFSALSICK